MTWHCAKTETPEVGRRIVVVHTAAVSTFVVLPSGLVDDDGFWSGDLDEMARYALLWTYLPDDFRLWCERRPDDPMDFSKIKPGVP
jgi:hypothetical protein